MRNDIRKLCFWYGFWERKNFEPIVSRLLICERKGDQLKLAESCADKCDAERLVWPTRAYWLGGSEGGIRREEP